MPSKNDTTRRSFLEGMAAGPSLAFLAAGQDRAHRGCWRNQDTPSPSASQTAGDHADRLRRLAQHKGLWCKLKPTDKSGKLRRV